MGHHLQDDGQFKSTRCSVYEKRPKVCHTAVKPGDKACREVRRLRWMTQEGRLADENLGLREQQ